MSNQAQIRYRKKAVKTFYLDLNTKTDADIIQWLNTTKDHGGSQTGEIKRACRNLIPQSAYPFRGGWNCPTCPAKYTPYPGQLISYCPRCGQAIINTTGAEASADSYTPVDTYGKDYTPVDDSTDNPATLEALTNMDAETEASADSYTPVDTDAESTPVDMEQTSTPVDVEPESTPVDSPNYNVYYVTKKGGEHYRKIAVKATNKKEAIAIFRDIHKATFQQSEGHAFRPTAEPITE